LHVPDFLDPGSARTLGATLKGAGDWTRSIHLEVGQDLDISVAELDALPPDERAAFERGLADSSADSLQYMFDTVRISAELKADRPVAGPMEAVHAFINGPAFLGFVAQLTGNDTLAFADVMATRYLPGHFLTAHGDENPKERRLYAYVLNMTPEWRADWGGVLMFLDEDGHVAEGYVPAFNALNIFSVPQTHAVSMVTRLARTPRLSVTGWLHAPS
jgi:SM-20-related protein